MFDNKILLLLGIVVAVVIYMVFFKKSGFNDRLINTNLTNGQPLSFPQLDKGPLKLSNPDVPEEIGLTMPYPQGGGVGMDLNDSNSFYPNKPGELLTNHVGPESYGESSLADPQGNKGAEQGARVLRIGSTGNQTNW